MIFMIAEGLLDLKSLSCSDIMLAIHIIFEVFISWVCFRCTVHDLKAAVRLIKHDIKINCGSKLMLVKHFFY